MTAMENAEPTTPLGWREERRRDRLAAAQIGTQARIAEAEASARMRREKHQAQHADRRAARKQRATRRADQAAWLRAHVVDLLFVPVITVPAILAWTAMAAYGSQVFGPIGMALPAFSEGAMWAFAAATTISLHRHPVRPVWHLRLGTVVFAAAGAVLNFIHGLTAEGVAGGVGVGVVMAFVSVAGVVAHQLVTAGPRRSRAERDTARARWAVARRERAIRRAARRRAVAEVDAAGNARLVYRAGTVTLARDWHGRVRLDDAPPQAFPWPRPVPVLDAPVAASASALLAAAESAPGGDRQVHPEKALASAGEVHLVSTPASASKSAAKGGGRKRGQVSRSVTSDSAARHYAAELAAGRLPSQRRIQSDLHVGQDRAKSIREHLARQVRGGQVVPLTRRA